MGADRKGTYYEEGSTTAQHEVVEWGPLLVAPSTSKNTFNTIRRPLIVVACWRLNHALFEFDSSFVVPETKPELARLARTIDANPGCPMAMFGHADPVGDDDYNKALSGRRARALHAVLTRDVAAWEELFSSPMEGDTWGLRSTQRILGFLQRADGSGPYYVGDADGAFGAATDDAIRAFQAEHDLMVDGIAGPMTRKVLYRVYMDAICVGKEQRLELTAKDFIHEAGAFQGCGEFNPVYLLSRTDAAGVERDERNRLNAPNRRVMLFFFEPGTVIDKADWPCPKWNAPAAGCHKALWPDADTRRKKGDEAREYRVDRRTMGCRFYDRMARRSPCEGVVPFSVDLFFDVPKGAEELAQSFTLESHDGVYKSTRPRGAATPVQERLFVLRFTKVKPGKRYSLYYDLGVHKVPIFVGIPLVNLGKEVEGEGGAPEPRAHGVLPSFEPPPEIVAQYPHLASKTSAHVSPDDDDH